MIRVAWRKSVAFLVSAPLVVGLFVFVGVWSLAATFVAQGVASSNQVAAWARAYPAIEPVAGFLGLHRAFTSHLFLAAVCLLAVSTAICSWRRTRVAIARARRLRAAASVDARSIAETHDLEFECAAGLTDSEVLSIASATLQKLGIKTRRSEDGVLRAVSRPWTIWGSTVFHWALVLLIATVLVGQLMRSEGDVSLAVGQTKPNEPASYSQLYSGPLHSWAGEHRSIRLDAFEPDYKTGGIDRGAVPTVSLLDAAGKVLVKQRVYQNMMLHDGSLAINAPGLGLAVHIAFLDAAGAEVGRSILYVGFSQTAKGGTVPVSEILNSDSSGKTKMALYATVPLEGSPGHYNEWIPRPPRVRVVVASGNGPALFDRTVASGQTLDLPGAGVIKVLGVGWHSRLSIVDDPTIPLLYAAMIIAMIGLAVVALARQRVVLATVVTGPDGSRLAMDVRLWRNVSTNRSEIETELAKALGTEQEERMS